MTGYEIYDEGYEAGYESAMADIMEALYDEDDEYDAANEDLFNFDDLDEYDDAMESEDDVRVGASYGKAYNRYINKRGSESERRNAQNLQNAIRSGDKESALRHLAAVRSDASRAMQNDPKLRRHAQRIGRVADAKTGGMQSREDFIKGNIKGYMGK